MLNVDRTTYTGWKTDKNTIPLTKLISFSSYFKYSIDYILGLSKNNDYTIKLKVDLNTIGNNLKKIIQFCIVFRLLTKFILLIV